MVEAPIPPTILYGSYTCPMVPPVRAALERAGVPFEYINISRDANARARVREINHGNESVPTLVFGDGSTLTEPNAAQLAQKLADLGYSLPPASLIQRLQILLQNPGLMIVAIMALISGWFGQVPLLLLVGTALLLAIIVTQMGRRIGLGS